MTIYAYIAAEQQLGIALGTVMICLAVRLHQLGSYRWATGGFEGNPKHRADLWRDFLWMGAPLIMGLNFVSWAGLLLGGMSVVQTGVNIGQGKGPFWQDEPGSWDAYGRDIPKIRGTWRAAALTVGLMLFIAGLPLSI